MILYAWNKLKLDVSPQIILLFILSFITASTFMIALINIGSSICFLSINSDVVMAFIFRFKDYAKYPVSIFNPILQFIFTFIIPIAFIAYYPSLFFLRPHDIPLLSYFYPVFGIIFFYISYKIWMKGALSYNGTGT